MFEKIEVNGPGRHAIYDELTAAPDTNGETGDIQWNFEKFPGAPGRQPWRPGSGHAPSPDSPEVIAVIEENLPADYFFLG